MTPQHKAKITRTTAGEPETDPGTGMPIPGSGGRTKTIYDGPFDYQDELSERQRSALGDADIDASGKGFFPRWERDAIWEVQEGDQIKITDTRSGNSFGSGEVKGVKHLDNKLFIKLA